MNAPLPLRSTFIGGSDAAAILGVSPFDTPLDLYLLKLGKKVKTFSPDQQRALKRGKREEPRIVDDLVEDYGIEVVKRSSEQEPNRYQDEEHAFLACEIDFEWRVRREDVVRFDLPEELIGTVQNGEVKTVHPFATAKFGAAESDEVPVEYAAQAMHGLMITGRDLCMFAVRDGFDLTVYWIRRDDETIVGMRAQEVAFWNDHVLAGVPPSALRFEDVQQLFALRAASRTEANDEIVGLLRELDLAKQQRVAAEDREVELKYEIGRFMLGAGAIRLENGGRIEPVEIKPGQHLLTRGGATLLTVRLQTQTRLDGDALREKHPEIAAECTKTVSFIRFDKPRKGKK